VEPKRPTFEETQQEDFLTGWGLGDIIKADSRNDTLLGDEGSDLLWGNEGNDYINEKQNNDTIDAGHDNDSVHGGKEDDQVFGDRGNDIIYGDLGNDILFGGIGSKQPAGDQSDSGNLIGSHREKAFNSNEGTGSLVGKKAATSFSVAKMTINS